MHTIWQWVLVSVLALFGAGLLWLWFRLSDGADWGLLGFLVSLLVLLGLVNDLAVHGWI